MPSQFLTSEWRRVSARRLLTVMLVLISVTACAPSYQVASVSGAEPSAPPPPIKVYFYPNKGQSPEQQDRDRYECYLWAKEQTGFDPSTLALEQFPMLKVLKDKYWIDSVKRCFVF